jgi:hypothetical protein
MRKIFLRMMIFLGIFMLISACTGAQSPTASLNSPPLATNPVLPTKTLLPPPTDTSPPPTSTEAPSTPTAIPLPTTSLTQFTQYPAAPTGIPAGVLPAAQPLGSVVAFAWNNLGMHCFQSDYSQFLILPPYNVFWTQVVARGEDPRIINGNVTAQYSMPQVTNPVAHTNFWDYAAAYGWNLQPGIGLNGKGTSGTLDASGDHFIAEGVPVVDVNDDGTWDPYPFFLVQVTDNSGQTLAETVNVAPASTEMSCYLCHVSDSIQGVMANILQAHDRNSATSLAQQAQGGQPVLCNSCHADPAMGVMENHNSQTTLSGAMHTFHADKLVGSQLPQNTCQACHPGPQTQCLRDAMATAGIVCTDCHGGMSDLGDPSRTPWVNMPTCTSCHTQALTKSNTRHIDNPNQSLTLSSDALYRNSKAHGGGGIYCAACHGSPHAIYPTITARDNEQSIRLQGHAGPITECVVCHMGTPDESFWHFGGGD